MADTDDWQRLAKAKLEAINESIPREWRVESLPSREQQRDVTGGFLHQYLSDEETEITEADATEIVEKTSTGQWTAETTNCLHETFFDAATRDAKALDEHLAKHKKPRGLLHGLPVSLKDQFHVKGVETTMGYVGWIGTFEGKKGTGKEKVFESEMVKELRDLGATWNPKNRNLSSGGSSGGEGALIGLRGSPVGLGSDIGGSVRIPAAFNGLYGLRPSVGRLPYEGMANSMDGQNSVLSVVGPLAPSISALQLLVRSLLSQEPWLHDPLVHPMPWRESDTKLPAETPLTFAVLRHDGIVSVHPPIRRAIETVVEALQKQGHTVIEWDPPSHKRGLELIMNAWTYDNGVDIRAAFALSGEPMVPQIAATYGGKMADAPPKDAMHIAANNVAKREWQKEYMEYWNATKEVTGTGRPVDAVIAPVAPFAAARPNGYIYYGYSSVVNALDYTACVIPVTTVDKNIDTVDPSFNPLNETDKKVAETYDLEIYDGAHVSVQLIGRRLEEEKVLALTEYVAGALKG
ncbi:MAG: hypothetical protein Q9207_000189 [Kuettlingeria erythrocarpa]